MIIRVSLLSLTLAASLLATTTASAQSEPENDFDPSHEAATSLSDAFGAEPYAGAGVAARGSAISDDALDANSLVLSDYVTALGLDTSDAAPVSLAGVAQNPSNLTVTVWWAGDAPLPSEPDDPKFAHVTLEVFEAERSHAEVMSMIQRSGVAEWDGIWSTASKADGSAAILLHDPSAEIDGEAASAAIGLPVITVADAPPAAADYRDRDSSPLKGAAGIMGRRTDGLWQYCSTGFPIVQKFGNGRREYSMVSAGHCAYTPSDAYVRGVWLDSRGQDGLYPGFNAGRTVPFLDNDLMLFYSDYPLISKIYRGAITSANTSNIVGVQDTFAAGTRMRTSGGMSGEHIVTIKYPFRLDINRGICPNTCYFRYAEAADVQQDRIAAAEGDSGGTVFVSATGGVRVAGVINAIGKDFTCSPPLVAIRTTCGSGVYFSDPQMVTGTLSAAENETYAIPYFD